MKFSYLLLVFLLINIFFGCQKEVDQQSLIDNSIDQAKNTNQQPAITTLASSMQIYGMWHAGNDACAWASVRTIEEFDSKNHWIIDRGNGQPSVNLVILSFVNPLKLLNQTNDASTVNGLPKGMTKDIVQYFKSKNIRVMLSIGGITYTQDWNTALATNATELGNRAAAVAKDMGVGIEIDYEESSSPNLTGLQDFITAYRTKIPYDATGVNHAARLTIDLAAGDRWLIGICRQATAQWLTTSNPVLDYANAMVPSRQPTSSTDAIANWQEHIDGKPQYAPPIPSLAPAKFTAGLYIVTGKSASPECINFSKSLQSSCSNFVLTAAPKGAGSSSGLLGYMFWAGEKPSTRNITTAPPNSCENGIGVGATEFGIPIPIPALRQQ